MIPGRSLPNSQAGSKWFLCPQLLPDPLSEAPGHLSLAEASSFLGILERVLAKESAPLGPAALLAVVHFLKRVTALGAGEPELLTGPWEQLGQGIVSVASLVLEEQLAGAWLSISEVRLAGLGGAGGLAVLATSLCSRGWAGSVSAFERSSSFTYDVP